jgi:hypothetical protein
MKMSKVWAMPNKNTFSIKPIADLIKRYISSSSGYWIDPFCGENPYATPELTNDLNPTFSAAYHLNALDFLKLITKPSNNYNLYFDPPYSPRQISECYKSVGIATNMQTTQSKWYADIKDEISRIVSSGNIVISACWNSNGIGMSRGFEQEEILIVAHGGWHNDTIVTVERKI